MRWYLLVILKFISLVFSDVEHFFTCLLAICISSLEEYLFRPCVHLFIFLILSCMSYLYILEINSLSVASLQIIFSHYIGCLFVLFFFNGFPYIFISPYLQRNFFNLYLEIFLRNCLLNFNFSFCSNHSIFDTQSLSFKENFSLFLSSYIILFRWQFHCKNHWFQYHYIHIPPPQIVFELYR